MECLRDCNRALQISASYAKVNMHLDLLHNSDVSNILKVFHIDQV